MREMNRRVMLVRHFLVEAVAVTDVVWIRENRSIYWVREPWGSYPGWAPMNVLRRMETVGPRRQGGGWVRGSW